MLRHEQIGELTCYQCFTMESTCGSGPLLHMAGYSSPQGGYKLLV